MNARLEAQEARREAPWSRSAVADQQSRPEEGPGRSCPTSYRYPPSVFARDPDLVAETLYVVGGLYGNVEALEALRSLAGRERAPATIVFNGDFHWFDVASADFERVATEVLSHQAIRGNVETEIAGEASGAGCGCAYRLDVSDAVVRHSNAILARLRETARAFPELRARAGALPMNLTARVGEARVGIVHGDAASLAGWGFAHDQLERTEHARWIEHAFHDAQVDVFASSHTCLPACREFAFPAGPAVVINNGAAGMPNFSGTGYGIVTRISVHRPPVEALYGVRLRGARIDALALRYDSGGWLRRFLAAWPEGSPAHDSYFQRMAHGPQFTLEQAAP